MRRLLALLAATSLLACAGPTPSTLAGPPADVDVVIQGGFVVTMDAERRLLEGGAVVIQGERIVDVLPAGAELPSARETIDATGRLVIPGLVNGHGHVPMVLFRGLADDMALLEWLQDFIFPAEARNVDADFCYWGTLLAGVEMARSGTTTFADMYYFEDAIARATDELGLRGVLGQTVIGFPAPDYATPQEALAGCEGFIERWKDHPRVIPSVAPHALYTTSPEVVRASAELARRHGVPFQIHCNESPAEDAQVREAHGATSVQVLAREGVLGPGVVLHHGITLTADDSALLAEKGVAVIHKPETNMKGASGVADVPALLEAGVTVGLGTDGGAGNNNLDLFEEIDTCAKVHKLRHLDPTAMPAETAFWLATQGGASALGLGDQLGSLEAGKLADVVLIDVTAPELVPLYNVYSQLAYAIKGGHVRTVLVGGRVVVREREMLTVNVPEVIREAKRLQAKILASLEQGR
jgi:5-methylthioadenosine/S-adenosylhomocysteine deaminase